jgi:CheY-like chemotaxis protein
LSKIGGYLKVLIIDADPVVRALLGIQVEEMGLKDNRWATNGKEALTLLKKNPTDLIICGVSVPEVDALVLLKACKEDPRLTKIPFIIMGSSKLLRAEALEASMDTYIVNPVSPDELQEALKKIGARPSSPHAPPGKE